MARETKQERIVRGMFDQVSEHLHELKTLSQNPSIKERDIETWCQSIFKSCLGFTSTDGYSILAQEARGKMRPDLIVSKDGKPFLVIEIKKLGFDLNKSDFRSGKVQLGEYLHQIGTVRWGILCNGYEWRLYDFSDQTIGGVEIVSFDVRGDEDELDLSKRAIEDLCWEFMDLHEVTANSNSWSDFYKEATAFSPESLARALLSYDVVKYVARAIRGEHEYKANLEVLIEKISNLVENGLDDSKCGWNEAKQIELHKYIKSQKRQGRKRGRKGNKEVAVSTAAAVLPEIESTHSTAAMVIITEDIKKSEAS